MSPATLSIVRVVSVTDTREFIEEGDRWIPVPGSGDLHGCSRCGRIHEVHATVELSDGTLAVVGTGCAKGESAEIVRALTNGANAAKRTRILEREVARERERVAAWDAKAVEFDRLPFPPISETYEASKYVSKYTGVSHRLVIEADGVRVWCDDFPSLAAMPRKDREERLECLRESVKTLYCGGHGRRSHYLRAAEEALLKHLRRLSVRP